MNESPIMSPVDNWVAERVRQFASREISEAFQRAQQLKNPIDLSIGQPDFDVPQPVKQALWSAVQQGFNRYALTQGVAQLREALSAEIAARFPPADRKLLVTSGSSGALTLVMLAVVNRGDEVILLDPTFFIYASLVRMVGGHPVHVDLDPQFHLDLNRIADAITPRTKMIVINTPGNPTGVCLEENELQQLAQLAQHHGICLVSDEIYSPYCFDAPHVSPAQFSPDVVVIDGFSKSHAMTGWRLAYAHGPGRVIDAMTELQQFTFVCAPHPVQWAGVAALRTPIDDPLQRYRQRRDRVVEQLAEHYQFAHPTGAFYLFPRLPWGTSRQFLDCALAHNLLLIPGRLFSRHDTHFRISYAVSDAVLDQGLQILRQLATRPPS